MRATLSDAPDDHAIRRSSGPQGAPPRILVRPVVRGAKGGWIRNPAVEAQAVDRAHRIGQDKTVMVYRLVSAGTIEEKVMALKARKQGLFDTVMDEDGLMSGPLTADDIRGLFE